MPKWNTVASTIGQKNQNCLQFISSNLYNLNQQLYQNCIVFEIVEFMVDKGVKFEKGGHATIVRAALHGGNRLAHNYRPTLRG